ncbi:MAG: hypothetical protein JRD93_08780 [Deltaproteobacteria bacterium]|nr:hypothetical protein [Deltaproteobacteria bacterium]MBW2662063.1 hypothetical protein [Deltaproteobacteria bacterium]
MFRSRNVTLILTLFLLLGSATLLRAQNSALAIFNFRPTNIEAMGCNAEILYALISALEKGKAVKLMSRREMEEILFHAGLVQGDNPDMILKAGKALSIRFILFGQITKKDGKIQTNLKLMDIQNKRVIKTWSPTFSGRKTIATQIPSLAVKISRAILNKEQFKSAASTQSIIDIENLKARSHGKKVLLTWKFDNSLPIVGFHVYRSENQKGPYRFLGRTNNNIFNDTKITKAKSYYYHVGIILSSGQEIKTKHTAQLQHAGEKKPHPPLILGGKGHVKRVEIKFVPSLLNKQEKFKITKYKIYRQKTPALNWEEILTVDAKARSQGKLAFLIEDNNNIEDGVIYTYAISSLDKKKQESQLSDPVSLNTVNSPVLTVAKHNLLRKIDFAWKPLKNVEGYYLYRKMDRKEWKRVGKIRSASEFRFTNDKNLKDGERYQHYLTAYDTKGETSPSNKVEAKTKDLPLSPENLMAKSDLIKSVKISWTYLDDTDVGGYAVYRGIDREKLVRIARIKDYRSNSFLDKGTGFTPLEDGTDYYYAIASFNLFGPEGKLSRAAHARTKPRPGNAKGLVTTTGQGHILVKWNKNPESDIKNYILYRKQNKRSWSKIGKLDPDQTSYMDDDLKPEKSYSYRIIVEDKDNLKSDPVESDFVRSPIVKAEK